MGSSPHMRGTPWLDVACRPAVGIIPAYAGNTRPRAVHLVRQGDHPRICGEHSEETNTTTTWTGSSPHMRGTLPRWCWWMSRPGIIPAYAGNTARLSRWPSRKRDHPRICGEHRYRMERHHVRWGSSPHMRGTLLNIHVSFPSCGIIPAYAGNTR